MTREELEKTHELHHTASKLGYVSRKVDIDKLPAVPYDGKFGKGFTVYLPRWDSSWYCYVEYWIEK